MKIASSSIGMESERSYTSVRMDAFQLSQSKLIVGKDFLGSLSDKFADTSDEYEKQNTVYDNKGGTLDFLKGKFNELSSIRLVRTFREEDDMLQKFRQMCINYILALLMGKKPDEMEEQAIKNDAGNNANLFVIQTVSAKQQHYFYEGETTSYAAKGKVCTEDGREIDFNLELNMSRSFEEYYESNIEGVSIQQRLMDPLVINFGGDIANVGDQKFYFDIDSDGVKDNVAKLTSNSGFLAYDINEDGIINDGSELFGTKSGDGFKDLAKYDLDRNGWIDENDDIYNKLKIYAINEDGSETLYTLKEKGVGAIYLGSSDTEFSLNNLETNDVNAKIRKTGIFLYENGSVGTVQHVDLQVELGA